MKTVSISWQCMSRQEGQGDMDKKKHTDIGHFALWQSLGEV